MQIFGNCNSAKPKKFFKKTIKLIVKFTMVTGHRVNIQNSNLFLIITVKHWKIKYIFDNIKKDKNT